jgi:hypothetical protein
MAIFPDELQPIIDELLPLCRALGEGKRAVSIGGSYGKGTFDRSSDLDFRLFCERKLSPPEVYEEAYRHVQEAIDRWAAEGVTIDGCWVRTTGPIDEELDRWIEGEGRPGDIVWTIWGYYLVTDVYNQLVIDDPDGIVSGWHEKLAVYPPKLKAAIMDRHLKSIRYWRHDYHYQHKVAREDVIFLAGLTTKLVHDLVQILFALNETYFPGDGNNLSFIEDFEHAPEGFSEKVTAILYPCTDGNTSIGGGAQAQYVRLMALIDEVEAVVAQTDLDKSGEMVMIFPSGDYG